MNAAAIIHALGAEKCSPELKGKIFAKFGEVLWKRLLLCLPDDDAKQLMMTTEQLTHEEGMQRLIDTLDEKIPDAGAVRERIYFETISEFRIKDTVDKVAS